MTYQYKPGFTLKDHWDEHQTKSLDTIARELRSIRDVLQIVHASALDAHVAKERAETERIAAAQARARCSNCQKWDHRAGTGRGLCTDARRLAITRPDDLCQHFTDKETA